MEYYLTTLENSIEAGAIKTLLMRFIKSQCSWMQNKFL